MGLLHDGEWEPAATRDRDSHDTFDDRIEDAADAPFPAGAGRYRLQSWVTDCASRRSTHT